ncbi:MAG: heparan-alpha-glucosaminide N-acetyltransferase domain-containing protein [Candidatus Acidiferrales bacterium]
MAAPSKQGRLAYIDWLRGFACVLMFEVHSYDSWLSVSARDTHFFKWSQLSGTLPAPLFLFLAGVSCALVTDKSRKKGIPPNQIARTMILRGLEILALGYLFRVQEYLLGLPWAPWTDLLRVDILNTIGLSIVLVAIVCRLAQSRAANIALALVATAVIALATPALYTTWRPSWLPWYLESYINGVHTLNAPQPWLFPVFPWAGFTFAGLALGFFLFGDWASRNVTQAVGLLGAAGVAMFYLAGWLDARPAQMFSVYDYWHTSPNFFLARVGLMMIFFPVSYWWCRWVVARIPFSPMVQMGQTSLLVYWVHIEFVYGRFSILQKNMQTIPMATLGFLIVTAGMVLLSVARTRSKGHGVEVVMWIRGCLQKAHFKRFNIPTSSG